MWLSKLLTVHLRLNKRAENVWPLLAPALQLCPNVCRPVDKLWECPFGMNFACLCWIASPAIIYTSLTANYELPLSAVLGCNNLSVVVWQYLMHKDPHWPSLWVGYPSHIRHATCPAGLRLAGSDCPSFVVGEGALESSTCNPGCNILNHLLLQVGFHICSVSYVVSM